ncbi:unnamed protein product [Mycena citricolor]|uniref:SYO1-like TPR repeats domain-containing protein n=1 Tax=Mycena citricolor TaxID=2018698 RepID=A0AAD2GRK2_9AGAR|nr:unnamed protein product [Mycena citricolor]CAK5274263.1 unnamed protein product [Mycena citricolor]
MGKTQKKRAMRRHNPVRVPDSHLPQGLTSAAESSSKTQAILPIMQKMQGTDAGERKWACVAVSNIIQNDPSTRRLLQGKNIVGALITRLTDSEEEVVIEAMGSLRNLAIDGGYDICAEMYNKSILVPLKTFVPKIAATLAQFLEQGVKHAPENAQRLMYEFADNVITVLWCLSETSNKALNAINEMKLASFLMSFLAVRDKMPLATITAAAQCLYVITDDNYAAISDVRSDGGYISCLMSIVTSEGLRSDPGQTADPRIIMLRVLASGILGNVSPITPPSAASALDIDRDVILPQLLPVISSLSLSEVSRSALQLIEEQSTVPSIDKLSLKKSPKTDHKSASEVELDRLEGQLRTVQLALEILTGVSAALPDPESVEGVDDELENEVVIEDEETVDEDIAMDVVPDEVERATQSLPQIVEPLLALIQPTTLSFPPHASPSPHPPTTSAMSAVHIAALECLNNIFLSLARHDTVIEIDAGRTVWNAVWSSLAAVGTQIVLGQERRQAMWEVAAGVLWGVASVCKGKLVGPLFLSLRPGLFLNSGT